MQVAIEGEMLLLADWFPPLLPTRVAARAALSSDGK